MEVARDSALWVETAQHYARCCEIWSALDADGFLAWLGPEATFLRSDGTLGRFADTRPFWAWRFASVLGVHRFDIDLESVRIEADTLVVDFHEVSRMLVRGLDGAPAVREADLHNRNRWGRVDGALSTVGGEELSARRTLDGVPMDDAHDPIGFAAWARVGARDSGSEETG